ncbi:hypothetical protein [Pseudomonas aeruginosa]|uniref:hypothetical protein n=1 Tax=Pseudomonas aeruginosa TaxID=287 RepID=UPI000EB5EB02|nr:hypothetical protein [Pseudomonas aeruginosa]
MSELQLSFLDTTPAKFDVNAVDDGLVSSEFTTQGPAGQALSQRPVDDWVFGLGFTNWKNVIDHAIQTGHYELFTDDDGFCGLRKRGYRYAPIPKLPSAGAVYVQQRLMLLAAQRGVAFGRNERMVQAGPEFLHKCVVEHGHCDLMVKLAGEVFRASLFVDQLNFSDGATPDPSHIAMQLARCFEAAGAQADLRLEKGCTSMAAHLLRVVHGLS